MPHHPIAPIPNDDPRDDGPSDDSPSNDNPDDNDLEDNQPDFPDLDAKPGITVFNSLAKAIKLLAHNAHSSPESSSRTKLHKPDTFDGTNPKKLHAFLIQCELNFQDQPQAFKTNHAKLDLLRVEDPDDQPLWMDSWREFVLELQTTFSPHGLGADAEGQLDHLHMKDNQHINKYIVDFNQLASQVQGYRDGVLHHHCHARLPDQIKDEVCQVGKPQTLHELCHLVQEIDVCYWECKEEVQRASKHQASSSSNKSANPGSSGQPKTSQDKSKPSSSNNNSGSSSKLASSNPGNSNLSKPEPSKLSKDRKLTPEECKHHIEGNLCIFCGGPSHCPDKCPKKAGKAKAHAMATTKAALALGWGSTPETKK
ncbi:hypothetical protein M404DRAFT_29471 [Pisolithus tinctorius Marx 270]|uniref:Retrotransposon gag domain-containing protein n=1 Tax=Pisolithus tinctorius Marx 270 TaxID=870435 RepID=A0A0C3JSU5_PISTI|nr:hypothetical protein M404DRAFT_29471 [Pisolithus tinctorius Marx 270]